MMKRDGSSGEGMAECILLMMSLAWPRPQRVSTRRLSNRHSTGDTLATRPIRSSRAMRPTSLAVVTRSLFGSHVSTTVFSGPMQPCNVLSREVKRSWSTSRASWSRT